MVISVRGQKVDCALPFPVRTECGMFLMCYNKCCNAWMCRPISSRYINVFNSDGFSVVNITLTIMW